MQHPEAELSTGMKICTAYSKINKYICFNESEL